ncbi:uncharacterized protein LOC129769178 [Toxorhynchites rutilus septentrionalis]|uniref:uncharacterized protein LOC129769178 n=1 Tax=Toxorhynchites rutilus septentrionalis TaxID=329112 RepID=UPI00247873F0|nr:uncharacterized protein LOC129769178 [Toxorhynchites rutilus septentrionalis]
MEEDLNRLSANIIANLDHINRILASGRLESKLLDNLDLPDRLLKLSQQEWTPSSDLQSIDHADRLSVEDVDHIFNRIRHRPTGGSRHNRNLSQKKPIPLQQSRILNETNLANSQSGSLTDLSDSGKQQPIKSIDVEFLVKSLKQSAEALGQIENRIIEPMDFQRIERIHSRESSKICDRINDIDAMIQDLGKYVDSERNDDGKTKNLMSDELVSKLRNLSATLSQVIFIKQNEYIPDMSDFLVQSASPLAECLDDINENIRQNKLHQ